MRTDDHYRMTARRVLAALLAWLMVFGPAQTAFAQLTPLGDIPIAAKVAAKPNIVYTLDDSGSMKGNFLPDYITNASVAVPISNITRSVAAPGTTATASGSAANFASLSDGDFVQIFGVLPVEFNGYFQIFNKTATTFQYTLLSIPVPPLPATTTGDPLWGSQRQFITSSAYCRLSTGQFSGPCVAQALNISPTNYSINTIAAAVGTTLATVTLTNGTAIAALLLLNTGDYLTIAGATQTEFNGYFQITKLDATHFTYTLLTPSTRATAQGTKTFATVGGTWAAPPLHASDFNRLAYNPQVTYTAPLKDDGTPLTSAGTDANGNYGTTAALYNAATVERDPFANYEVAAGETPMWPFTTKDNLNLKVNVAAYCNTDWPLLLNDGNWPAGPNGITALDVGDTNGQYSATAGGYCRINGTEYEINISGAPHADADYNYPWRKTSGGNNAKFFYQSLSRKVMYCDTSSPWRPRTGTIQSCIGGTTTYSGPPVQQTCNRSGNVCNPVPASRNYNPASCKTDPANLYCAPNIGGSDGYSLGTGSLPECQSCTCVADTQNTSGRCSLSNAVCSSGFGIPGGNLGECPDRPNTITDCGAGIPVYQTDSLACTKMLWNPYTNSPTTTTLLDDSEGAGVMCRHNNIAYAVGSVTSGLFTYPRTQPLDVDPANASGWTAPYTNQTGAFTTAVNSNCPIVGTTVAIPRHYYVLDTIPSTSSTVQFCDNVEVTANLQWRGFGIGACQDSNDLQQYRFVKYGRFQRIDLFAANTQTYPANADGVNRVWLAGASPGPDNSESINYANWYAYYSTRLSAGKTTSSIAFSFLNALPGAEAYRVGFHNFGDESPPNGVDATGASIKWVDVDDWNLAQRTKWYNALFGIAVAFNKTPTMNAMLRVGSLFESGVPTAVAAGVNPLPSTAADPIPNDSAGQPIRCQNNYHILFTDGKTNQNGLPAAVGDQDAAIPAFLQTVTEDPLLDRVLPNFRPPIANPGDPWPRPFVQGTPGVSDTLSDIATYYWATDLRAPALVNPNSKNDLANDVPNQSGAGGGDIDPTKDVAWWQHINFSAISFGAEGTLDATRQPATMGDITAGIKNWPNLTQPNDPIYPKGAAAGAVAVDDLWHATAMARGSFVYARTPTEVSYGLASILAGIQNQRKSRAAAAFSGQVLDATTNIVFIPTIEPGWAGDLIKREIDPITAAVTNTWWNASQTLADQIDPALAGVAEPWMDENHRRIVTLTGSSGPGVPFRYASLTGAQRASLASTQLKQEKLIAYLRGGNTYTPTVGPVVTIEGTSIGQFRKRYGVLGDISNAEPVIVNAPDRPYLDGTDPGYETWKASKAGRSTVVVAPANDGMVHVFDAGPMPHPGPNPGDPPVPASAGGGTEIFAFIPKALFRGVAGNAATEDVTALQALAYQDGGVPIYHHHMYVDSSPREADVDFSQGSGTGWRSIVVGGLGKGGNSYYALDLTDVTAVDEAAAASKVLWEWSDPEVKYSYGRPVIVKVRETGYPTGRWVVIVTGGYNNASGTGKIFFLDASDGSLLSTVTTGAGSAASPSGLAQIHAFVQDQSNQIAEQIYGGDLFGNLWRVDVSVADSYKTAPAVLFAELTDGANPQPVTTAPQIEIDVNNGVDRYVFIGTGRLLDQSDFTTPIQVQSFYAIRDGTLQNILTTGLPIDRGDLKSINLDTPDQIQGITGGAPNGWYHDLPSSPSDEAQRIVVDVQANVNIAQYIGTKVPDDPCLIQLPAVLYARDYTTGRSLLKDPGNLNGPNLAYINLPDGAVGNLTVGIRLPDGTFGLSALLSGEVPGTTPIKLENPFSGPGNRLSWRLLGVE